MVKLMIKMKIVLYKCLDAKQSAPKILYLIFLDFPQTKLNFAISLTYLKFIRL
jgi:hypothetical protein